MKKTRRALALAAVVIAAATTLPNLAGAAPTSPCADFTYEGHGEYVVDSVAPGVHELVLDSRVYLDDACTTLPANDRFRITVRVPDGTDRTIVAEPVSVATGQQAPAGENPDGTAAYQTATAIDFRVPLGVVVDGVGSRDFTGQKIYALVELLDSRGRVLATAPGTEALLCRTTLALETADQECKDNSGGSSSWN